MRARRERGDPSTRSGPVPPPPFLSWRKSRYLIILFLLIALNIAVTSSPWIWRQMASWGINPAWRYAMWAIYAPGLTLLIVWFNRADQATKRRVLAGELPCWGCGYDLRATESPGRCPECGQAFDATPLREKWKAYLEGPSQTRS